MAGTEGADFHEDLKVNENAIILNKGQSAEGHGYSGFEATDEDGTTLEELITPQEMVAPKRSERIAVLFGGLATDNCVKATVLGACGLADKINIPRYSSPHKLSVFVIADAIRAANLNPRDNQLAIGVMKLRGGARFINSWDILAGSAIQIAQKSSGG